MAGTNIHVDRMAASPNEVSQIIVPPLEFEPFPDEVLRRFPRLAIVEQHRKDALQRWLSLLQKNLNELRLKAKQ